MKETSHRAFLIAKDLFRYGFRLRIVNAERFNRYFRHNLIFARTIAEVTAGRNDLLGNFYAFGIGKAAEGGILTVQMGSVVYHDEELTAGGIGTHGASHGEHAGGMLEFIGKAVAGKFAADGVARAAPCRSLPGRRPES